MSETKSFKITGAKGFHLTFPNGVTVSTQFGPGNYGDNYNAPFFSDLELAGKKTPNVKSNEVEIAIWVDLPEIQGFKWITAEYEEGDSVLGYKKMEDWLKVIDWARAYKPDLEKLKEAAIKEKAEREENMKKWKEASPHAKEGA